LGSRFNKKAIKNNPHIKEFITYENPNYSN
jgi:hypothetical protein